MFATKGRSKGILVLSPIRISLCQFVHTTPKLNIRGRHFMALGNETLVVKLFYDYLES